MEIRLLGGLAVCAGKEKCLLGTPKQQLVFAMLALHAGRLVTVDELVDELWPEDPPRSAVPNVRTYAANLRRTFESTPGRHAAVVREPGGYRLTVDEHRIDLLRLSTGWLRARELAEAGELTEAGSLLTRVVEAWRGRLCAGLPLGPSLLAAREAVERERQSAVEFLAELQLRQDRADLAVSLLRDHASQQPIRETAQALLMRALVQAGDLSGALAVYQATRDALAQHLGVLPGPELEQLRRHVIGTRRAIRQHGSSARPESGQAEPPGHSAPPPNYLPRIVPDFVGRREIVERMLAEIEFGDPATPVIRLIDGMAGCGKTTLAVHLAAQLADRCPDGYLFIDLAGHSEKAPVPPAAALVTLLRQLEVPAGRIPGELPDRMELWRRELAFRKVVVVLDNAADSAQVDPLLPVTGGCVFFVTSRRRLSINEAGPPMPLPVLTDDEAVQLLARTAGEERIEREPEAAAEVVRRCGHLPLAIRLAGGRLAHRPAWRVADLAHRLSVGGTVLRQLAVEQQTVVSAFSASYEPLAEPVKRLFRLISVHPGAHFDSAMAAALADLPLESVEMMLDDLLDQHLIEEVEPGRYRLHDLMRQYSVELSHAPAEVQDREEAAERLLDHLLHEVAGRVQQLEPRALREQVRLQPPRRPDLLNHSRPSGEEWLERERANLVAAVEFAERKCLHGHAWRLARCMWRFCYMRGYFDDILVTHRSGLTAAERSGDQAAQAVMHNYLASAYTRTGSYADSLRHLEAAVSISHVLGDHGNEHRYRANLVVVHWLRGDLVRSVNLGRQQLRERLGGSAVDSMRSLPNLGFALATMGRYDEALAVHRLHLFLGRCHGSQYHISNALGHIAAVENRLGHFAKAVRLLTASLRLRDRTGHRFGEAEARNDLGIAYRHLGRLDAAAEQHELALELARDSGERHVQAAVWNDLGRTLATAGRTHDSLAAHQRALELATRIAHPYEQGRALVALADYLDDDPEEALRYRRRALAIFQRMGAPEWQDLAERLAEHGPVDMAELPRSAQV